MVKMIKKLLIPFLIMFVSCAVPIEVSEGDYSVSYSQGKLSYFALVTKPTPCHLIEVGEAILESFPAQVHIKIDVVRDPEVELCAQVLTDELVTGEIDIGHKPASVTIYVREELVFTTTLAE